MYITYSPSRETNLLLVHNGLSCPVNVYMSLSILHD